MELRSGGDATDWLFLAMAHWQSGDKDEARRWYNEAIAWMEEKKPADEQLQRFRAEAAELLGLTDEAPPTEGRAPSEDDRGSEPAAPATGLDTPR